MHSLTRRYRSLPKINLSLRKYNDRTDLASVLINWPIETNPRSDASSSFVHRDEKNPIKERDAVYSVTARIGDRQIVVQLKEKKYA